MNDQPLIFKIIGVSSINLTAFIVSLVEAVEPALRLFGLVVTISYTIILIHKALKK
jgi:hypothetical protein